MKIAIDFDGVIHDYKHPVEGRRMGPPVEGIKDFLELLVRNDIEIIIFTVWGDEKGQKTITDFMNYYQLPFNSITNIKPNVDAYIDDKAIRFNGNWKNVYQLLGL